jgi:hypothetical protein
MYDSAVEEDFGSIGDVVEDLQGFLEFIVIVMGQCLYPCFNFLSCVSGLESTEYDDHALVPASETCPSKIEKSSHCLAFAVPPTFLRTRQLGQESVRVFRDELSDVPEPRMETRGSKSSRVCEIGQVRTFGTGEEVPTVMKVQRGWIGSAEALLRISARSCRERGVLGWAVIQLKGNQ